MDEVNEKRAPAGALSKSIEKSSKVNFNSAEAESKRAQLGRIRALISPTPGEAVWQGQARDAKRRELQRALANEFGRQRGWRLSSSSFSATVLANRSRGRGWRDPLWCSHCDHPDFFRTSDGCAAAVLAHNYDIAPDLAGWAAARGLLVSFPPESSWYYPHVTKLVLFEPRADIVETIAIK